LRFIRDNLMNADRKIIGRKVMKVMNVLQDMQPDQQLAVAASLFILTIRKFKENPTEVLSATDNMMHEATGLTPEFKAAQMYFDYEF